MKVNFRIVLVSFILTLSMFNSFAQITINNTLYTPTQLVDGVLVPSTSGTVISNVQFRGVYNNSSRYQVGYFSTATTTLAQMGFSNGIVLTTGNTSTIPLALGSNPRASQMATAYTSGTPGELRQTGTPAPPIIQDLDVLAGASNYFNGAILEFDFVPVENSVSFRYVFGSEEYSDNSGFINYQCSTYNDKFGFLISGPGIVGGQGFSNNARNIARLGNGSEVSINSVNSGVVGSSGGAPSAANCLAANAAWIQNTPTAEYLGTIDGTQLNGNTRILTASQTGLTPGQTYHIKLIITDVGDATYDSVVYIEAGSFTTEFTCDAGPDQALCNITSTTLAAVSPATGTWSVVSGSGTFVSNTNPNTVVNGLSTGANVFRWTASDLSCTSDVTITVNPNVTPTFAAVSPICSGATLSALPTTSTNGINGTWSPALNNTATTTYTFTPTAGQCATTTTLTITVNPNVTPTFAAVSPICSGATLSALPTTSTNGINGTWSPALNNTTTTIYTFTPTAGQCATNTTLTITVNPNVTPTFAAVAPICSGATLSALPTTSTNGINGTWSPALNNTATTTYTFTPTAGQCATTTTLTITVNPNVTPTFAAVAPICSGATLSALPTTSTNGINGTWSPALNNTTTTTYIFTPTAGQCATTTTLTITVNPNVTPTFAAVAPICSGATLSALPTTSTNGINGTWSPALNNTTTTTYTFTPTAGQCATTTTLTITVNPTPVLTVSCGVSTASSVTFNWNSIADATSYSYSYSVDGGPVVTGSLSNATTTFTINSLAAGQNVSITITPVGSLCGQPATSNCVSSNCPTPIVDTVGNISACSNATISAINFTSPSAGVTFTWTNTNTLIGLGTSGVGNIPSFTAANVATQQVATIAVTANDGACSGPSMFFTITVNPNVTPTFAAVSPICSGATLSALPTTSTNGINGTWSPALNNTTTTIYTFTPTAGQCATTTTLTITVNPNVTPTFAAVSPICSGATLSALPTTSTNGINGTWSPALNNTTTTIYTFTPTAGQCATNTTLTITVNPNVTPTFAAVAPICSGATLSALPTTSTNGINGSWSPALNNTATTTYTFTPTAGQCATTATLTITVTPNVTPTFTAVAPICSGATLSALPTTSTNGINGTWSPALNNTTTTTYTFTPTAGQCATTTTLTITVNPNVTPTFAAVAPICSGATLSALPTTSTNGINGTWSPALNNTATTTYTFTPTAGQCATTTTLTITVNPNVTPTFAAVAPICSGATLSALPTTSTNGINGSWSPALDNMVTTTYTFTPLAGQCATNTTLTITVNPNVTPIFAAVAPICSGTTLSVLPTTSTNGINGTWSPALNNTTTTTYTFTPTAGECATTTTLTITVTPNVTPTFTAVAPICSGATLSALPTISTNGINGTWSPTLDNTATTTYTFTPTAGQCATVTTMTIIVNETPVVSITHGCNGLDYELNVSETLNATYQWFNSNGDLIGTSSNIVIAYSDTYEIQVTLNGCMTSDFVTISNAFCLIPKGISPNNDGDNDTWDLSNLNVEKAQIFNRYGMEVYSQNNYTNQWDGTTDSGDELPSATYYYVLTFINGTVKTGWVYLNRLN
ncbi:choice-of-anchor L domain-containing protein [Flavobacterium sp.]|uniref:choice-of-anchor L domain-containing protein n=2 Tax=Flavobacterium sp. TaxID=239 RepID=UPI0040487D2D